MSEVVVTVRRSQDVAWVDSGDRVVVVRLDDLAASPGILMDSAAEIWRALDSDSDLPAVVRSVAAVYGVEPAQVAPDVAAWLAEADLQGLISTT